MCGDRNKKDKKTKTLPNGQVFRGKTGCVVDRCSFAQQPTPAMTTTEIQFSPGGKMTFVVLFNVSISLDTCSMCTGFVCVSLFPSFFFFFGLFLAKLFCNGIHTKHRVEIRSAHQKKKGRCTCVEAAPASRNQCMSTLVGNHWRILVGARLSYRPLCTAWPKKKGNVQCSL